MDQTYLIFSHRAARFALPVRAVREIVWLPAISLIEELPSYIVGVFNLRGRVVPVMDLGLRFGHAREPYCLADRVIVIASGETRVGIIANELHEVLAIAPASIEEVGSYQGAGGHAQFVTGEAKLDDGLAMLLDVDALLRSAPDEAALAAEAPPGSVDDLAHLFANLSKEDAETLHSRTQVLAAVQESDDRGGLQAYATIRLDRELFGLGLDEVREFSHLRGVTPVPCCPPHIVGNMNLRGDILTLADLRPMLGMATGGAMNEVVVVRIGELLLGLPVTEVVDVVHLAVADIAATPVASDSAGKAYCKGVATVGGEAVGILDLQQILAARELQVAEYVQ
ncbi:MAG: purine-binding chemotaxis protein CheW [Rhodocyclaceae bacterium]|nr:MAG: purine-binding chemotaxis protein CheW [Rhodocyclaceae bacterium]